MQTVAHYLMRTLRQSGVEVVFGYPGQSNLVLLAAVRDVGLRYVQTADERGAGFAAAGYTQATGKPGVVCASKGPGTTNLLTPLVAAKKDGVPLLAITGNVHRALFGKNSFQDFNATAAFTAAEAVKAARYVHEPQQVPRALSQLFSTAWTEPYGPVLLDLADDILSASLEAEAATLVVPERQTTLSRWSRWWEIKKVAQLLVEAQRPVLVVGAGARQDYALIRAFATAYDIPVVHTMGGTGVMATSDRLYGGLLRHNGSHVAAYLVQHADLLIALGTGLDERATGDPQRFAPQAKKVHVDLNKDVLGRNVPVDIALHEPIAGVLTALSQALPKTLSRPGWINAFLQWKQEHPLPIRRTGALKALELVEAIAAALPESIVVKDSGHHKYWMTKYSPCRQPAHAIASCHFGAMGFGLPAAIGASLGRPEATVVAVCGDGGLLMSLAELHTAAREGCANLKIVVFNDGGLGSTRNFERRLGRQADFISDFNPPISFVRYARAAGIRSYAIRRRRLPAPLRPLLRDDLLSLRRLLRTRGLMLFDCTLDARETMYPAVPYTHALDELLEAL
ncbi:MAG: acetolactate synthase isozyme 2 large subunit [Candidatus Tectimicrobiota bacterium]|nr:MAG: acetolactate synthase isozyme 2 large subunit [Candidatus Tectomicrobia bacterium]